MVGSSGLFSARVSVCVQRGECWIVRSHNVRVIAEPLQTAIPNIAANVVVGARRYS